MKMSNVDAYNHTTSIFCSSKKLNQVLRLIRGKGVSIAKHILMNCSKRKCSDIIYKSINSAVANGVHNYQLLEENLYLTVVYATKGRTINRTFPRAKGVSNTRRKHVSALYIGLENKIREDK